MVDSARFVGVGDVPVFGLANSGCICWFNSLLQALLATGNTVGDALLAPGGDTEGQHLRELARDLFSGVIRESSGILSEFMRVAALKARKMGIPPPSFGNSQECAEEGLTRLIDCLGSPAIEDKFTLEILKKIECPSCGHVTKNVDKCLNMKLFGERIESVRGWLLRHESLCDEMTCDACGTYVGPISIEETLSRTNDLITFVLDKYDGKYFRDYPEEIMLRSRVGASIVNLRYAWVAQIEHAGTKNSGHYWANARRGERVFVFNDSSVSPSSFVVKPESFIIIYKLIN